MGKSRNEAEELTGVRPNRISEIWTAYQQDGKSELKPQKRGRKKNEGMTLSLEEQQEIRQAIIITPHLKVVPTFKCGGTTVIGCFAHVRRKFDNALKSMPAESRAASSAAKGLDYCNRLFDLERESDGLPPEQKHQKRLELGLPIAEAFLA